MRLPNFVITPRARRPLWVRPLGAPHSHFAHHPVIMSDSGWEVCDFPDADAEDRVATDHSDLLLHERVCHAGGHGQPNGDVCPWCRLNYIREMVFYWNVIDRHDGACRVLKLDQTTQNSLLEAAASILSRGHPGGTPPDTDPHGVATLGYTGTAPTYDYEFVAVPSRGWLATASPYDVAVGPKPGTLGPLTETDWLAVRLLNPNATTVEEQQALRDLNAIIEIVPMSEELQRELFDAVPWPQQAAAATTLEPEVEVEEDDDDPLADLRLPPQGEWDE